MFYAGNILYIVDCVFSKSENKDDVTIEPAKTDFADKSVKELKETYESLGLSKCGVKAELTKRLESFHNGTENELRVVEWRRENEKT